ncbi:MAG: M48 family metallopeptidase [Ignavibacteria bacterium]|nr:M48 family metallopeptidase [Ignavibacteria bacterium]
MATQNFPNIYEQQNANRRKTILIMVGFVLFFGFLGFGFDLFYLGNDPFGVVAESTPMIPVGTILALLIGGGMALWGLQGGAQAVLRSAGAVPVSSTDAEHRVLSNVVDEMVIASGLPRPQVYVIPDPDPNAFATGKDPHHSHIAVTKGLLEKLNREELQGVIAHEIAHIRNYDIRLMTVIAALIGAALLLSDWAARSMRYGIGGGRRSRGSSRSKGGGGGGLALILLALWILAIILAPFITRLLSMAVSRQREYLADATAAELTRNPLGLANALQKIESASAPTQSIKKSAAHLCIVDPLGRKVNFKEGALADLFATHPPIAKRIMLLNAMAYQRES